VALAQVSCGFDAAAGDPLGAPRHSTAQQSRAQPAQQSRAQPAQHSRTQPARHSPHSAAHPRTRAPRPTWQFTGATLSIVACVSYNRWQSTVHAKFLPGGGGPLGARPSPGECADGRRLHDAPAGLPLPHSTPPAPPCVVIEPPCLARPCYWVAVPRGLHPRPPNRRRERRSSATAAPACTVPLRPDDVRRADIPRHSHDTPGRPWMAGNPAVHRWTRRTHVCPLTAMVPDQPRGVEGAGQRTAPAHPHGDIGAHSAEGRRLSGRDNLARNVLRSAVAAPSGDLLTPRIPHSPSSR
jgi:hypothetical protein